MKISNPYLRFSVAFTAAIFPEVLDFGGSRFIHEKIRSSVRKINKSQSPYLIIRTIQSSRPVETRPIVNGNNLRLRKEIWTEGKYFIEEHDASHLHNDFSIIVNGKVLRMARTPSKSNTKLGKLGLFPGPGERSQWIKQPEHFPSEVPNRPVIETGYGAGTTKVIKTGTCFVKMSKSGILHVFFEDIDGVYALVEDDKNVIMVRKSHDGPHLGKHKMKVETNLDNFITNTDLLLTAKKDGAAVNWIVKKDTNGRKWLRIYSHRTDARFEKSYGKTKQIDHTERLGHLCDLPVDNRIPECQGRGEIWSKTTKSGRSLERTTIKLNTEVVRSRQNNARPYLYIHGIDKWNGKDYSQSDFEHEVLPLIEKLNKLDRRFKVPPNTSSDREEVRAAFIQHCRQEPGVDGVVAWKGSQPIKFVFRTARESFYPAFIVGVEEQAGIYSRKYAYPIVRNQLGAEFKISGKGLTQELKSELKRNPDQYIGTPIYYSCDRHFKSGKPFQPILQEFGTGDQLEWMK